LYGYRVKDMKIKWKKFSVHILIWNDTEL